MQNKVFRIAITGPESTGKSQLARELAYYFNTVWVKEFARTFLNNLNREYVYDDILNIAIQQIENENTLAMNANSFIFCDTDLTVCKIWCEFKYKKCHEWINESFKNHVYDLYLLCDIDLPWEYDPQRENADERTELFNLYVAALQSENFPFVIISGSGTQRTKNAINEIIKKFEK